MSFQTHSYHVTSPDTGIDLCDDAASEASPCRTASSLDRRATQEEADVSVTAREELVSDVTCLRDSRARMRSALDQTETDRKQLREIPDQVQRDREQSSTKLAQLREQVNPLSSIDAIDRRQRGVEYNLPRFDNQLELGRRYSYMG